MIGDDMSPYLVKHQYSGRDCNQQVTSLCLVQSIPARSTIVSATLTLTESGCLTGTS
jgi:hypothetical protein